MEIAGYIVYGIGIVLAVTWMIGIRTYTKSGQGVTMSTVNTTMLFIVSLVVVPILKLSPLHLLWMYPASFILGMLSLAFPFSLLSIPGNIVSFIACAGLNQEEIQKNEYQRLAKDLAQLSLTATCDETAQDFMIKAGVPQNEFGRFIFNLTVANSIICIFAVNLAVKFDENTGQKILDPFLDFLMKNLNESKTVMIGDYIVHKDELEFLQKHYDVTQGTSTNIFTLFDMIYPIRSDEYYKEISIGFQRGNYPGNLGPMFPLSKRFIRNHSGDNDVEKHASLAVMLSIFLYGFFSDVTKYCVGKLSNLTQQST